MFTLRDGLVLALYPRNELAKDANVPLEATTGAFSVGHLVSTGPTWKPCSRGPRRRERR